MKKRIGVVVLVLLLLLLAGAGAGFYYYYSKYINIDAIYPGVTIQGMSVGGMTQEEAEAKVQEYVDQVSQETVTLQVRKKETAFPLSDIGLKCTNMDVVEEAYNLGKTGNVFKRVMEVRELEKKGTDFPLTFSVDKEETKKVVAKKAKKFLAKKKDATIKRVDGKFVITKHVHGIAIDFDANAEKLAEVFDNKNWDHKSVVFPMDYTLDKAKHTKKELSAIKDVLGTYTTSCIALALMFGIGGASCFNLNMGRGSSERAVYFVGNAIVCLIGSGVILFGIAEIFLTPLLKGFGAPSDVLPYAQTYVRITAIGFPFMILTAGGCHLIRADGSPQMAMICNLVGAIVNTILDAVFVMVFRWGMAGAAWATIIGQIISAIIVIHYLLHFKTIPLKKEHFYPQIKYIGRTAQIGMASFFNQIAMMLVQIVMNNSLTFYGASSIYGEAIPLACAGIVIKVNQIFFSIVIGLSQGSQPVESFNYGAKKYDRVRKAYRLAALTGVIISIFSFVLFQIFPRQILGLFGTGEPEYFTFGVRFFRLFLFFIWLDALQPITSTFFTSIGKPAKGIFLSLTRQIIFFIPLLLILPRFMGIEGCIYCGPIADFLSAVVTIIMAFLEFKNMPKQDENR